MKLKDGVIMAGLDIRMRQALIKMDSVYKMYQQELTITSGLDGCHSAGSLHYYGLALDIRTRFFTNDQKMKCHRRLVDDLGLCFKVILEKTHIHIQYKL